MLIEVRHPWLTAPVIGWCDKPNLLNLRRRTQLLPLELYQAKPHRWSGSPLGPMPKVILVSPKTLTRRQAPSIAREHPRKSRIVAIVPFIASSL